jgi:uncharacterized protein (TIGR02231 family)
VSNVSWDSEYDLYATTDPESGQPAGLVSLKYRARVMQSTGEDWTDASLILSTATSDTFTKGIPELLSLRITPRVVELADPRSRQSFRNRARRSSASHIGNSDLSNGDILPRTSARMTEPGTLVAENALALNYAVEGASSLPSDGAAHQVSIATFTFEAETSYVTVPRAESVMHLACAVRNTSDYRLLPGPVSVYVDDSFVSKTSIQTVDAGDTFRCTLGPDPAVRVSYTRVEKVQEGQNVAFMEKHNSTVYTTRIAVTNKHKFAVEDVVVRDAIPLVASEFQGRARVLLKEPAELAEVGAEKTVDVPHGKVRWVEHGGVNEGRYEWLPGKVEAGQEVKLKTEFEVRAPADMQWNLTS